MTEPFHVTYSSIPPIFESLEVADTVSKQDINRYALSKDFSETSTAISVLWRVKLQPTFTEIRSWDSNKNRFTGDIFQVSVSLHFGLW